MEYLKGFNIIKSPTKFQYCDCVYILKEVEVEAPIRIGIASNPSSRVMNHQLSNWREIHLCHILWIRDDNAKILEKLLHWELHPLQINRDWFNCTTEDVINISREICNHYKFQVYDEMKHYPSGYCDFRYTKEKALPNYKCYHLRHELGSILNEVQQAST
jgi:hypothetical protein